MKLKSIKKVEIRNKPVKVLAKDSIIKDPRVLRILESNKIWAGKKVLVRADLNAPILNSRILDDGRIKTILPTIKYLVKNNAKVILISHLGDPLKNQKSKIKNQNCELKIKKKYSLKPIYQYLKKLNFKIKFADDCLGIKTKKIIGRMRLGEIILMENLRFYPEEEKNDLKFAKKLAGLADIYVNEGFSVSHRKHASLSAITKFLPSYGGFLLEREIKKLTEALKNPKHPFVAVVGGAKISTKLKVIKNLLKKVDYLLIGGALANNFFKAQGCEVGKSLVDKEMTDEAKSLLKERKIILPVDAAVKNEKLKIKNVNNIKKDEAILDIGPKTTKLFSNYIKKAKMIVFNGPMGIFEKKGFDKGTKEVIKMILSNRRAKIIIGGGETIASLKNKKKSNNIFISTGGGAMLEFLEGKNLPGITPLMIK